MRYLPHAAEDRAEMLKEMGKGTVDELYSDIPAAIAQGEVISLPKHQSEKQVEATLSALAKKNRAASDGPFFLGAGSYFHHIPATVDYVIQRSEFLTSYTPYQPEVSQGTLQVIFEFQTAIAKLTGMDIANASMYDGSTALAEAALMAQRIKKNAPNIAIYPGLSPQYRDVLTTYLRNFEQVALYDIAASNKAEAIEIKEGTACVIVDRPNFYGEIHDLDAIREACDKAGALLIVVVREIVSLGLLPAPSQADIVIGEAQGLGVPLGFGGPYLGFFACKQPYLRQMPGRLCGLTTDVNGKRSFVLTLNAREQHIRRDKATSNICTNQGLCALAFTVHVSLLGEKGLMKLAKLNHIKACMLRDKINAISGYVIENKTFFNEFSVKLPTKHSVKDYRKEAMKRGIVPGLFLEKEHKLLVAVTEMVSEQDMDAFCAYLKAMA